MWKWFLVLGAVGCGMQASEVGAPPLVTRTDPASAVCPFGGSVVGVGHDRDGNGRLDDGEVERTTTACFAEPPRPDPTLLVRVVTEPVGEHCGEPGAAVQTGPDRNGNGALDPDEVTQVDYLCGGDLVTRIAVEPPGARCVGGGVRLLTGRDRDHDAALDDDEVVVEEVACGEVVAGDVIVRTADDAAALAGISTIAGDFTADGADLGELVLPCLVRVGGALAVRGSGVTRVALPALVSVERGMILDANPQLRDLELPKLVRTGGLVVTGDPSLITLDGLAALADVVGDLTVSDNAALTRADLAVFFRVAGAVTLERNPQLAAVAWTLGGAVRAVRVASNAELDRFELTLLFDGILGEVIGPTVIAANDQLHHVKLIVQSLGGVRIEDNPVLADATVVWGGLTGGLTVQRNGPLALALDGGLLDGLTLAGPITSLTSGSTLLLSGDLIIDGVALPSLANLKMFEIGGDVRISNTTQLTSLPFLSFAGSLEVRNNAALTTLGFVSLFRILGDVTVRDNPALRTAPSLAGLTEVRGDVEIANNPLLTQAFGASLFRIGGAAAFDHDASLGDLGLASLAHVGGLAVTSCDALTSVDLPALRDTTGPIAIAGNAALRHVRMPALAQADLDIVDNPQLPACEVAALFAGLLGDHHQSGNDETTTCTGAQP